MTPEQLDKSSAIGAAQRATDKMVTGRAQRSAARGCPGPRANRATGPILAAAERKGIRAIVGLIRSEKKGHGTKGPGRIKK